MTHQRGVALLVVLFVVMVITITALGFLSKSDIELACGQNMKLRVEMDYTADSGLAHARGLIISPQDLASEYWGGDVAQQIAGGDDYYDVEIVRDDSDPNDRCNYIIDCNAYRLRNGEKIGRSNIRAQLRLDPCIALWTGSSTTVWSGVTINGDVYCNGTLLNNGAIYGDVFANALTGSITGQQKGCGQLSLVCPRVTVADFISNYATQTISSGSLAGQILGSYNPVRVCYRSGSLVLGGNVQIEGMLVVDGDLAVQGSGNIITAAKNLPALLVTGNMIIESGGGLEINGLAVVDGAMQVSAGAAGLSILGGLFIRENLVETTADSSGNGNTGTLYKGPTWRPAGGYADGALEFDGDNTAVQISTTGMDPIQGTISLWAYAEGFDNFHHYLFGHTSHTSTPEWWVDRIQLYTDDENGWLDLGLGDAHARHTNIYDLDTHKWYHIGLTWDGTGYVVYVDGAAQASGSYSNLSVFAPIADIGNDGNPTYRDESFRGIIDDVRIYDRVLDANDIYPPIDGLVGLIGQWKLDETGSSVTITAAPCKTAIVVWSEVGEAERWEQVGGAFFRSIKRRQ